MIEKCLSAVQRFLKTTSRNVVYEDSVISLYLRKSARYIDGFTYPTLDIARISIKEEHQGKGIGTSLIQELHLSHPFPVTYIECILNERFLDHLLKHEWILHTLSVPESVYRIKT